ncbi:hypothetical protein H5J24_05860 [Chryseobacterium capnotolerans]|uniref:hypothetical protein n=1 Tax=Chryseobacterium TaxID=59732 RepID=UPI0011444572|nr:MULTISPECIES: hypothetical protein [Chryseobacterium]UHO39609.1 hypothetical protein H5J24_05860 [Chryseobacterium capnotolerans]
MKTNLSMLVLALFSCGLYSQVGINTATPESTLDVRGKNHLGAVTAQDGVLVPRVNSLTTNGTVNGQLVYLIADAGAFTKGFHFWNGTIWQPLGGSGSGDPTKDAWVDNTANTRVELGTKSDGTARTSGTEFVSQDDGRVGIGTPTPNGSSMLEVNATDKGFLPPRVVLSSSTLQLNSTTPNATGLWVYNTGGTGNLPEGYYYWDGFFWKSVNASSSIAPQILSLACNSAFLNPTSYTAGVPYNGNLRVTYTEGNGGKYGAGAPFTVNGLTFTLRPGTLEYGTGELVFSVTGTPISTTGTMSLPFTSNEIPFLTTGQECTALVGNNSRAEILSVAVMGYPVLTTDTFNGKQSYTLPLSTPDGKYAIRVIFDTTNPATAVRPNVQLINLSGSVVNLYWNYNTEYGGYIGSAGIISNVPINRWGGSIEGNTWTSQSTGALGNAYWGNEGIMDASNSGPEHRRYSWIDSSVSSKTAYTATIMAGAPASGSVRPDQTKVFIKIEEVKAQ